MSTGFPEQEIHLYTCCPSDVANKADALHGVLSPDEHKRLAGMSFESDRLDYLVAHAMLRVVLSRYSEASPHSWQFTKGPHGKPELLDNHSGIEFNLAHTRDLCAVIVTSGKPCGVDVEILTRTNNIEGIAWKTFSEPEIEFMGLNQDIARHRFFQLWSLREAYLKALGVGMSGNSKDFGFGIDEDFTVTLRFDDARDHEWSLALHDVGAGHVMATCVERGDGIKITGFDAAKLLKAV